MTSRWTERLVGSHGWCRRLGRPLLALAAAGAVVASSAGSAAADTAPDAGPALLDYTADEIARIVRHGPWPMPLRRDPGNPVAGHAGAIALGQRLFFDARLSVDGTLSCAGCHVPSLGWADGRPRSIAREPLDRHAPSLLNAAQQRWYGWDGAADSLWHQALRVMLEPREFGTTPQRLQALVRGDRELSCRWKQVYGGVDARDPERTMVQMARAIAAYVGTLQTPRTSFDDFRDALARGDRAAAARYPLPAQRGARLFVDRARCALCHVGPLFTNGEFADIGLPFFVRPGVVDPGRHGGIAALQASRYNLLGRWAVLQHADDAGPTRHLQVEHRHFGEFKVPALRHVAATAPYMHDGSLATLDDVVRHYDRIDLERLHADGQPLLRPLYLSAGERGDLVAFLRTLGDGPVPAPAAATRCR